MKPTHANKDRHQAWQAYAYKIMRAMINRKIIYPARRYDCLICGNPAEIWEHRDYTKPFDIYPACHRCNMRLSCATSPDEPAPRYTTQSKMYCLMIRECPRTIGDAPSDSARMIRHALALDWPIKPKDQG